MIKFIQDYTTKALPPESFEKDQEVERSTESERYFVQLGVAGYLIDDKLVDQEYRPIVVETIVVVGSTDRRFADAGRGGETLGFDGPQRASTGPGNAVMFGREDVFETADGELHHVQVEQLASDLPPPAQSVEATTARASATSKLKSK